MPVARAAAPCPINDKTRKRLYEEARKIDLPLGEMNKLAKLVSGQPSIAKLNQSQAEEALVLMLAPNAAGRPKMFKSTPALATIMHSPSYVLGRSRAGERIFNEAEKQWFVQHELEAKFNKAYHDITSGLTKAEKDRIAQFRLRIDPKTGGRLKGDHPANFLNPKLQAVNKRLTDEFFEPMFRMGVEKGLVGENQHIDDYLTYYREAHLKLRPDQSAEMAEQISQELGISRDAALELLKRANVRNVSFGPFDYRRALDSIPGIKDLDQIADIYHKGFARKVAVSDFLKVANELQPRIKDDALRAYAKDYISQYAGRPTSTAFANWIKTSNTLSRLNMTEAGIAGKLTAVQFYAKIGFNLFTPALNLTQTVINTVPKVGLVGTAKVIPSVAASILLPEKLNPFTKTLERLRESQVLDSLSTKFERPELRGKTKAVAEAAAFLFDKSESFNRGVAYLAAFEQAKRAGKSDQEAKTAGREMVRITQFMTGRLDAPLLTRTSPISKLFLQFKTFTFKEIEFVRSLDRKEFARFALATVAMGGPAATGIGIAIKTFFAGTDLDDLYEEIQETWNIAAFLHADNIGDQLGVFQIPGVESLGQYSGRDRLLAWAAGPTLTSAIDTVQAAYGRRNRDGEPTNNYGLNLVKAIVRGWVPGGAEWMRVVRAMDQAKSPEEAVAILLNTASRGEGKKLSPEVKKLLGQGNMKDLLK